MNAEFRLGAVLLAAGRSSRMGRPKLLLPWQNTSILGHLVHTWGALAEQAGVVCAAGDSAVQTELDRVGFDLAGRIFNPAPERGMFSSIQCAAGWDGWQERLTHWAIVLGDQPQIGPETLRAIIGFSAEHPDRICVPKQDGHRRHPVILPKRWFEELAHSKLPDLKSFLDRAHSSMAVAELPDPALGLDIDYPEDYHRAAHFQ